MPSDVTEDLHQFGGSTDHADNDHGASSAVASSGHENDENDIGSLLQEYQRAVPNNRMNVPNPTAVDIETGVSAGDSAMAFVCGYVAHKASDKSLGAPSSQATDGPLQALWVRFLSQGGLTVPTEAFYAEFLRLEAAFCAHHELEPDQLSRKPRVIADFIAVLRKKFPAVPIAAVRVFARLRTFMRMKYINDARRTASLEKSAARKRKQCAM